MRPKLTKSDTSRPSELAATTPTVLQPQSSGPRPQHLLPAVVGIPRPESPTAGSVHSVMRDPRPLQSTQAHSHTSSSSNDVVIQTPALDLERHDLMASPISSPDSSGARPASTALGTRSYGVDGSGTSDTYSSKGPDRFEEILERF